MLDFGKELKKKKVTQKSLNGEIINVWGSISEAAKKTNSSKSAIIRCCKNKQNKTNNFIWEYKT